MKLSFSLSSSKSTSSFSSSAAAAAKKQQPHPSSSSTAADRSRFVTVFDPSETLTTEPPKPVISPLENTNQWRAAKRMKNLVPPSDPTSDGSSPADRFVVQHIPVDNSADDTTQYGLNLRAKVGPGENLDGDVIDKSESVVISDEQRFRLEMENLPEHRGMDEFADVAVEDFSKAVLEGYGWKEGKGLGRNRDKDVAIVEQKRWDGTSGLGFSWDLPGTGKKEKEKNGHGRPSDKPPLPPSTSGGADKKRIVRVVSGKHVGQKGEVLKTGRSSDNETVVLRMLSSGEKIAVRVDMIAELGSLKEEKCLGKLKELSLENGDGGKADRKKRSRDYEHGRRDLEPKSEDKLRLGGRNSNDRGNDAINWLRRQIRVRVISKRVKGGRFYLKKGVVTDVITPMICDVSMDETGELLQGIDQEILETVLPRNGGLVFVLYGRHKGVLGKLMEKDKEKETAMVQDVDSHRLINVRMEQIAEYIGDPDDIGY